MSTITLNLRRHISSIHYTSLPPKDADGYYSSLDGKVIVHAKTPDAVPHYAWPSCWTFRTDLEWMKNHMSTHETQHNIPSIPIKTKKDTYLFRDTSSALHPPKRPKITSENFSTLSPVATIINPYNEHLSPVHKRLAKQQIMDQANMVSLKQYPTAYNMLKQALDVELPNLPHFLWTFVPPDDIMAHGANLIKIIQFVLTEFCS